MNHVHIGLCFSCNWAQHKGTAGSCKLQLVLPACFHTMSGIAPETAGPWSAHSMTHISMKRVAYFGSCLLNLRRGQANAEFKTNTTTMRSAAASQPRNMNPMAST